MAEQVLLVDRARAAIDDAFAESIKARFAILVEGYADNVDGGAPAALGRFHRGLASLKAAHNDALRAITDQVK